MDNTARRAELAEELRRLNGPSEDEANLARAIAVIAPSARWSGSPDVIKSCRSLESVEKQV